MAPVPAVAMSATVTRVPGAAGCASLICQNRDPGANTSAGKAFAASVPRRPDRIGSANQRYWLMPVPGQMAFGLMDEGNIVIGRALPSERAPGATVAVVLNVTMAGRVPVVVPVGPQLPSALPTVAAAPVVLNA